MNTYGWMLLGQTLLALLVLGLCGGWSLWLFRRAERPYLWLAAPLAGLLTLGGSLEVLYFFVGLPFRWCLWIGMALNAIATVACLVRGRPSLPPWSQRAVAATVVLGAAYWGTTSCNKTAIEAREPTIAALDGSDMFGYSIVADWIRAHPASQPPRADVPLEVMAYANLNLDGGRDLSFLYPAVAAQVRGTSPLFSYDWASGVILSAAILGFGGAFASNSLMLVLLVAGGGTCNWLANARSGYFAKSIAYPGTVLLASLFLHTASHFTWKRLAALVALGFATSYALAPVFPTVVLGMILGCLMGALVLTYPLNWWRDRTTSFKASVLKPSLVAIFVYAVTTLPVFASYYLSRPAIAVPGTPTKWRIVIPVALDLEPPAMPLLKPQTENKLLYASALTLLILGVIALRHRQPAALALLCCALVVPISWLLKMHLLYTFQGMIYPLTLAGAALLAAPMVAMRWSTARTALLVLLIASMVGLRVPQVRATATRYLYSVQPYRTVIRQSDAKAIRAIVKDEAVDVSVGYFADNHLVYTELAAQGVEVRLRAPAWDRSLRNWARVVGCPEPNLLTPKARYSLVERNAYAPPGTERWVGTRLKLIEDRDAVTIMAIADTQEMVWDTTWRPGVWIGNTPTTFLIHNGTGQTQFVALRGDTSAGPSHPDRNCRTLVYRLNGQTGELSLPTENKAVVPLRLQPGLNRVELLVKEPASPAPLPGQIVAMLAFCNWSLEPALPLSRADQR